MTRTFIEALRTFPGISLELMRDGRVLESNGRLERLVGRSPVGEPLRAVLEPDSARKWDALLRRDDVEASIELTLEGVDGSVTRRFHLTGSTSLAADRLWLIELPRDEHIERLHDDLTALNSELVNTQRDLVKGRSQLNRLVSELESSIAEKTRLSDALQRRGDEVAERNRALSDLAEELRQQQEELSVINDELAERTHELEAAMAGKERLHAIMSHELRTPLTAIAGYNHLLLDGAFGELRPEQRDVLQRMRGASLHLQALIDDVLDYSKLEAGQLALDPRPVAVRELLDEVVATIQPMANDYGSVVQMEFGNAPDTVVSDARRLRQILLNLLSNAAKYGAGTAIVVRARRHEETALIVEVSDSGEGIPTEQLGRIFEEFVQLDGTASGSGLGLPIARRLAELLGGRLEAESAPGRGSTFRLALPAAHAMEQAPPAT